MMARTAWLALGVLAGIAGAHPLRAAAQQPRYAQAIEDELASMQLPASCVVLSPTRSRCSYKARSSATERGFDAHAVYDDATDTVYFYVERYLVAPAHEPKTKVLLNRLMELNWALLGAKLEWNPRDGEVRLTATLHTDSNFDRRAFRSIVLSLDILAARYHAELRELISSPEKR
jgi:hypothetical protein